MKGKELKDADKAMILIHGRGGSAEDILSLADVLNTRNFALLAPQAYENTWYPYNFMAPVDQNEPGLTAGLDVIRQLIEKINEHGITEENIYLLGFSQGACLVSEYLARFAQKYGGAFIFSGGLIGRHIERDNYSGDFESTSIIIGCSDIDPHIPLHRVKETTLIFKEMGGNVTERIYPGGPHTVFEDEIELANEILK